MRLLVALLACFLICLLVSADVNTDRSSADDRRLLQSFPKPRSLPRSGRQLRGSLSQSHSQQASSQAPPTRPSPPHQSASPQPPAPSVPPSPSPHPSPGQPYWPQPPVPSRSPSRPSVPTTPATTDRAAPSTQQAHPLLSQLTGGLCPDARRVLERTNAHRSLHRAAPLEWDELLANSSQARAEELLAGGSCLVSEQQRQLLAHAHSQELSGTGENVRMWQVARPLARRSGSSSSSCLGAVEGWFSESRGYAFGSPHPYDDNVGKGLEHFTQLVWLSSSRVGCGVALGDAADSASSGTVRTGGCKVVVCRYFPPGNDPGDQHFRDNVLTPFPPPA